jgi:hypothetical protein
MDKLAFAARAKPGLTRSQALAHLRDRHAGLVAASGTLRRRLKTYIQNHALDAPEIPRVTAERDWIIESWRDPRVILPEPPTAPDAIAVRADEGNFPDRASLLTLKLEQTTLWAAQPGEAFALSPIKVFTYLKRRPDLSPAQFDAARRQRGLQLAATPAFQALVRRYDQNRAIPGDGPPPTIEHSPSAARTPPYDGIDVFRCRAAADVAALFADAVFLAALDQFEEAVADRPSLFRLVTRENIVFDDAGVDSGGIDSGGGTRG